MPRPLRIFLCHASQDKPAVRRLHRYLKQHGIEPWLDELDLLPGENWEVEIPRALYASDVILVCLSKNSINKEGYVQKEISFALDKALEKPEGTIFIIPAKLEDCEVPKRLNRYQWVDLFRPDSNKRLLLGLNKRALSLGSDVSPVILEDTRQRKSALTKPVVDSDQLVREAVEKAAREKTEREEAEKAAQAKLERESAEQAEIVRLAQEAKERSEREAAEKIAREKFESTRKAALKKAKHEVEREAKRKKQREFITANSRWLGMGGSILIILIFGGFGLNSVIKNLPVATATPVISPSTTLKAVTPTKTKIPQTSTPVPPTFTPTPQVGSTMISTQDDMVMAYVPAGEFTMGSTDGESDELPVHQVYLDAFWIDKTEVTNFMYTGCVDANQCDPPVKTRSYTHLSYFGDPEFENYPVIYVDWRMAQAYCKWAGRRLPTEAEWEKASRGIDALEYPWGNALPKNSLLNYNGNSGDTTMIGNYPEGASDYGALDMAGNVLEWVEDWYDDSYYQNSPLSNPLGAILGQYKVLRGGSWNPSDSNVRSAFRYKLDPSSFGSIIGFRCALEE